MKALAPYRRQIYTGIIKKLSDRQREVLKLMPHSYMPKARIITVLLLGTVVIGGWFYFSSRENSSKESTIISPKESTILKTDNNGVLDCSAPDTCLRREITHRYTVSEDPDIGTGCSEEAYNPGDSKPCEELTQVGVEAVSFIADPANYIDIPLHEDREYEVTELEVDLFLPWDIEFLPDGRALVTEKQGAIKLLSADFTTQTIKTIIPVDVSETGLLGLAIDPNFEDNHYVYTYHTYQITRESDSFADLLVLNRVTRWIFTEDTLRADSIIVDAIPGSGWHAGGRLEFGPDGYLYITTGDAADAIRSQEYGFLGGKVLRVTRDGEPAPDNPEHSLVYSRGHRNPQGVAWARDGVLFVSEHGPKRYDEIHRVAAPGQNNGWGVYYCDKTPDKWKDVAPMSEMAVPDICYDRYTMAPSGMEIVRDPVSPWYDMLFIAGLRGKHIQRVPLDGSRIIGEGEVFFVAETGDHRLRDVEYYNGDLYVLGNTAGLWKLSPVK